MAVGTPSTDQECERERCTQTVRFHEETYCEECRAEQRWLDAYLGN